MNIEDSNNDKSLIESIGDQFERSKEEQEYKKRNTTEKKMYIFKIL